MNSLEDLKKSFIVDEESFEEQELTELVGKINQICFLDKLGGIRFRKSGLKDADRIRYFLVARFLANKLDAKISKTVTNREIEDSLKKSKPQVRARLSEIRKSGVMKDVDKNSHEIVPFYVHKILLEKKNG